MEVTRSHRQIAVVEASQPSAARFAARDTAELIGFGEHDQHRAGLIATELATNLVKHATGGELLVRGIQNAPHPEMELIAIDRGPGMDDVSRCLLDGHSTAGSPGTGLGALRRMADDFDVYSEPSRGTVVMTRLRAGRARPANGHVLDIAGVSVAKNGEAVCGDAWQVYYHADGALAVLADGLGHGLYASEASSAAVAAVDPRKRGDLAVALQAMHAGLRHTRGAAAAVAEISVGARLLKFAGVGNISGAIHRAGATRFVVSLNGTLGHEVRQFREYSYPWEPDALFVMFSDGLGSRWSLDDYRGLRSRHPVVIAAVLYRDFSRQRDDVTVVVGREARG